MVNQGKKIKIGIDASNLRRGGGVTHLVELLRANDPEQQGIDRVVIWGGDKILDAVEDRSWIEKSSPRALNQRWLQRSLWQRFELSKRAREAECDILFVPGGSYAGNFHPVVTMSRNMLPFERAEIMRYGFSLMTLRLVALRWMQSRSYRAADGTIFLTRYARNTVLAQIGELEGLTALIPHGVDPRFAGAPYSARALDTCSDSNPFRIVYVSIIDHYKHQDQVATAVMSLRKRGYPIFLELIGPSFPPARERLDLLLRSLDPDGLTVQVTGPIHHHQLPAVFAGADLAVFASSCENMPNILLEMMAAGLPIACSERGPMPEVLGEADYFDPEHPDDIADNIERLMLSPGLRERRSIMARERAAAFTWNRCAQDTFSFISQVACRSRQSGGLEDRA